MSTAVFNPPILRTAFDPNGSREKPWLFEEQHTFYDGAHYAVIPPNFRSDAESVPWYVRPLIPSNGLHKRAAFFHDAAYAMQNMSRFSADAVFRVVMEHDGVPTWRCLLMYFGVRLFGWAAWLANREAKP